MPFGYSLFEKVKDYPKKSLKIFFGYEESYSVNFS